jgi:hypothetical protein
VTSCDRGCGVIGGTNVGSGASLIVTAGAITCAGAGGGGGATGCGSFAPITAQPPTVAANDAAVINIFTPGALVAGFLVALVMLVLMFGFVFILVFRFMFAV